MKIALAILAILLVIGLLLGSSFVSRRNQMAIKREAVNAAWSQVDVVLQRRADLIPNLVETVKGFAAQEVTVFGDIAKARSALLSASTPADKIAANQRLDSALGRLLVVVENYPQLKSNENFLRLQDELAGTENRIAVERRRYNGTIARDGRCAPSTVEALKRVRASGRKLILATGRQLAELQEVFPEYAIFDRIVAENGAVLYRPASQDSKVLANPPAPEFVDELRRRGVYPLSVGQCIVATWHPFESTVLEVIRDMGLELQVIFNKDAVMVLPSGVNKASGLQVALNELRLSPHNAVGVGDAENDHVLLGMCECGAAVANALPALKERADLVTNGSHI